MTDIPIKAHLLTVRQVSVILQVHTNTVINYIAQGKLKGHNPNGDKKGLRVTTLSVRDYLQKYILENFDEKAFEEQVEQATRPVHTKTVTASRRPRTSSWVKSW